MIPKRLNESLAGKYGSYVLPFIWYTGESKEVVAKEIQAVHDAGAREFVFENRAGDWFATDFWWDIFRFVLETAKSLDMRVWSLDDSHVNTGSANDSLSREENARFRAKNLRLEFMDVASYPVAGAISLPRRTDQEKIIRISAFQLDEQSGETYGDAIDLTGKIKDGLCMVDLPAGLWRIYFIMTVDPEKCGVFKNYITMVSRESCRHLIDEVHEKFYAHLAEYFGNTFAGFFSDEPAFGNCDGQYGPYAYDLRPGQPDKMLAWWDDFPERLAEKLDITPEKVMELLPAVWDGMKEVSSKFRLAYMDLITQLWEENFCGQIGKWCEEHHVGYIGHNLEDDGAHMRSGWGCGHYFRSMSGQHMSGMDLVFEQLMPGISGIRHAMNNHSHKRASAFYHYTLPKMAASLAHQTPGMKNRALSEVFGATGWTCGVFNMHAILNLCQVSGINHFIPHAFSMNLPDCFAEQLQRTAGKDSYTPPGYCLRYLPPNFYTGSFNPQFPVFGEVLRCAQRVSHLTYHAAHRPDAAVYYPAECDWMNNGSYQDLDEVTMTLARGGYDYDILPQDALNKAELTADGTFIVNGEKFRTLIVPGSQILPANVLDICRKFAVAGVNVLFAGELPERTENGTADTAGLKACPVKELIKVLKEIALPGFRMAAEYPDLRHLRLVDEENNELIVLFNSGVREMPLALPQGGMIYDPWKNKVYSYSGNQPLTMTGQQLLIFYPGISGEGLPEFPRLPEKLTALPLKYRISMKEAGNKEFRILRENSPAVDLLAEENLSRTCAEFKYEAEFDYSGDDAAVLEIPRAGDAAELIINGESCGFSLGTVCRFDVRGLVKQGRNRLEIRTFDNPAYIDRKEDSYIGYGAWFPLLLHGIAGDILIG